MLGGADGYAQLRRQRGDREAYARMRKGVECMHGTREISGDRGRAWESVGDCERTRGARVLVLGAAPRARARGRGGGGVGEMARGRVGESVWGKARGASSHLPWGETNGCDRSIH